MARDGSLARRNLGSIADVYSVVGSSIARRGERPTWWKLR